MGFFDGGAKTKELMIALTPHGRECLETDAVELNQDEKTIMYYLKEHSAKSVKMTASETGLNYAAVKYIANSLIQRKLVEYI